MGKIIVFGAAGGTGKQVVEQALQAGYHVTAVVRNPDAFPIKHKKLDIINADVFQPFTFENEVKEKDAVISCLGTRKRVPTSVYSEGTRNIMKAMQKEHINRLICLSSAAVTIPPKISPLQKFIYKNILHKLFRHIYADMRRMEEILSESNLNWTAIRPTRLINAKHARKYKFTVNEPIQYPSKISRADLAEYILTHMTDEKTYKAVVGISY